MLTPRESNVEVIAELAAAIHASVDRDLLESSHITGETLSHCEGNHNRG